jgi:hypothetical protein
MKKLTFALAIFSLLICYSFQGTEEVWTDLFDGETLTGWMNPYDHGEARVINGEIKLTADKKFFLVTENTYSDFIFEAEDKLPEGKANSGFMFRCHVKPNKVCGYQAEGTRLHIWVNGILFTDYTDDMDAEGYIGLQHHGENGQVYRFRNIRIKEL